MTIWGPDGLRAATLDGAEALGRDHEIGSVEPGKLADLVVIEENPLANLKVLYGTGAIRLDENNVPQRVGGVETTLIGALIISVASSPAPPAMAMSWPSLLTTITASTA